MKEIKCPACETAFKIDETGYAAILKQVRTQEFDDELDKRLVLEEKSKSDAVEIAIGKTESEWQQKIAAKDTEITRLQSNIDSSKTEQELAVTKAVSTIKTERDGLATQLQVKDSEQTVLVSSLNDKHQSELTSKDELIEYYKDLKAKLSTKMVGETLEQHCETEFDKLRSVAFQNAYFEKDNDASGGTKGDYIFREEDTDGNEIISIMFDMKNENDETATKKKNEDFLSKLDSDRNSKNCEYAVLVTLLEADSDLYNTGIVDVSHEYPKMYVIRPQFFIPMISLLRNAAESALEYKAELALVKEQHVDVTNFENKINTFKEGFARNYKLASSQFEDAVDGINKTIKQLEKTKAKLLASVNNMRLASDRTEDLTIKRLTRGNPTMKAKFDELG